MKKLIVSVLSLTLLMSSQAMARDLKFTSALSSQGAFNDLTKQAGAAIAYRNTAPAEPLGLLGFDAGVEVEAVDIKSDSEYWNKAFGNDAPSYLLIPKLRVRKGLPFSIDVGAMYSYVPDSNIRLWGVELSKAILDGTLATPALGVRATYTRLAGVNDLDLQTAGIDATLSKGILFLTPYVGGGAVWIEGKAKGNLQALAAASPTGPLKTETTYQPRVFGGVKISPFPLFAITAEAEYMVRPIYSLKAALNF